MLPDHLRWLGLGFEPEGDTGLLARTAHELEAEGNPEGAATLYDRAFGIDPQAADIRSARADLLDRLAVTEQGIHFRYVPAGAFLMGSEAGEPDERPRHPVRLSPYWLSETPISWASYCRLMDWEPPPVGFPRDYRPGGDLDKPAFFLYETNKIRLQYCEDRTTRARGWHAHYPGQLWQSGGKTVTAQELFGTPPRDDATAPWTYDTKPMVAVGWQEVQELADVLSTPRVRYGLPTEAQWEKAARGGLIGARYPWGDAPPDHDRCDFGRFGAFSILPIKGFAANGYGLYAMSGGVWEWTRDWYDRDYYRASPDADPAGPDAGEQKVLRGGSWADCAEAVTVSFRMARDSRSWRDGQWGKHLAPNIGFRLCRTAVPLTAGPAALALPSG
jgi:formylglycine-generating enzyme required for sulfatase activity